jgi:hypothetical protein
MSSSHIRVVLLEIADLLERGQEDRAAASVREALSDSEEKLADFLGSNELWGGAGSMADQSLTSDATRRKALESLLIKLGKLQMATDRANPRTEMWVQAFEQWLRPDPR